MSSPISNKALLDKCSRFIMSDTSRGDTTKVIKDALITSKREIDSLGERPMAWNREIYNEIFTRYHATISDVSQANPCVITASSLDPDISSGHGFSDGDIVYPEAINGEQTNHRLNHRLYRVVYIGATTFSLTALDGQRAIDSTNYQAYSSGGTIYHAGIVLPRSTIEPSSGSSAPYYWDIKRVYDAHMDGRPCHPISQDSAISNGLNRPGSRPCRWRYQQYAHADFAKDSVEHILHWYPYPSIRYNVLVSIEKEYPDISTWSASVYPPCPAHVHDFIWHRALANLATHGDKQRRRSAGKAGEEGDNTKMEVLNANYWIAKALADEEKILQYSRTLEGVQAHSSKGMSA